MTAAQPQVLHAFLPLQQCPGQTLRHVAALPLMDERPSRCGDRVRRDAPASDQSRCTGSTEVNRDPLYEPDAHLKRDAEFPPMRGKRARAGLGTLLAGAAHRSVADPALSRCDPVDGRMIVPTRNQGSRCYASPG